MESAASVPLLKGFDLCWSFR